MFKLAQSPTYWHPVELVQIEEDGSVSNVQVEVQFLRLTETQEEALLAEAREKAQRDRAVAPRIMRGWRKVGDERGVELPFTDANRDAFLDIAGNATAVVAAWFLSRNQAALGNLTRSRVPGSRLNGTAASATPSTSTH